MPADENCIFCKIAAGKIPCRKLFEDEYSLAFLDIEPASKGHALIIPKSHYPTLLDIPEMELGRAIATVQKVAAAAMKALHADGFNLVQNNRKAAGQAVHHLHFHVVPRFEGDNVRLTLGSKGAMESELAEWEKKIKENI